MIRLLPGLLFLLALVTPVHAQTIQWGDLVGATVLQSDGSTIPVALVGDPSPAFHFEIGSFGSFVPDDTNTALWKDFWKIFDAADFTGPTDNFFQGSVDMLSGQVSSSPDANPTDTFAAGEQGYIWIYNDLDPVPTAEWVLITNDGSDVPGRGPAWTFPAFDDQTSLILDWRTDTATTPIYGGLNDTTGPGERTDSSTVFDLQTHTFVPEPDSAFLLGLGAFLIFLRRGVRKIDCYRPGGTR